MKKFIQKWMNGPRIIRYLENRRLENDRKRPGVVGDFYRAGGRDLIFDFPGLSPEKAVIDAGGYHGAWAEQMLVTYGCPCHIYEPMVEYSDALAKKFERNRLVEVVVSGLAGESGKARLSMQANASSMFSGNADNYIEIKLTGIAEAIDRAGGSVGCLKMNIEGAEFDVLDGMAREKLAKQVDYILVQFHEKVPDYPERYAKSRDYLKSYYSPVWEYGRVWQLWKLK